MVPVTELHQHLGSVVTRGLALEPRFAEIAARWERWWRFDADRPLLVGTALTSRRGEWRKPFDLIESPEEWLRACRSAMEATYFVDQTVPSIRVDFGPVLTAAFLGAELQFASRENTSWQTPVPDVYERDLVIDPRNRWYQACMALAQTLARDASGSYLVSLPDLSGATDILANLRGSQELLMDLYDRPDDVRRALATIVDAWEAAFTRFMSILAEAGAGATSWLHAWSEVPYTVPTCDFNAMIGPEQFAEFALPYLEDQGRRAPRCLFHLDGPDAARHAPALARSSIDAIQFTPGAGSTGAVPKIPMFRMLQEAGKPILVIVAAAEVPELLNSLDPRGTALFVEDVADQQAARELESLIG